VLIRLRKNEVVISVHEYRDLLTNDAMPVLEFKEVSGIEMQELYDMVEEQIQVTLKEMH
jgi:hypothetical protein